MTTLERLIALLFLCAAVFVIGYSVGVYRMKSQGKECREPKKLSLDMSKPAEQNWINYYRSKKI